MSQMAPEPAPRPGGDGEGFRKRLGPLPMWGWVALIGAGLVGWRVWTDRKAGAAATATDTTATGDGSTPASDVPQFVNQTYTTVTPPVQGPPPVIIRTPGPRPPQQLTRTWESLGGSTYAQVAQRLLGNSDVANLHPANKAAVAWVNGPYKKNHHAIMPKGLLFTYTEGTVTDKTPVRK